jgi:hypothetical protein
MVDYNIVCNEIAKRVESGELSSEEAQSIMEKADAMYGDSEVVTERVSQSEVERRYSKALSEAKTHGKNADLYAKAGKYKEAIRELNAKKDMINEVIDVINSDTTGFSGALAGSFIQGIYDLVPNALIAVGRSSDSKAAKVAGAVGAGIAFDTSIKTIRGMISEFRNRGMSWDLFNGRKSKIIGSLKTIINVTDIQIKYYEKCDKDIKSLDEKDSKNEEKKESTEDIMQAFNDIDAYLEGCSGCKDKKKKKCKKCDEVTEAVIDAIAERIEAVTEAYLDDKIDEDEYNECMTLLDVNNYDCFE